MSFTNQILNTREDLDKKSVIEHHFSIARFIKQCLCNHEFYEGHLEPYKDSEDRNYITYICHKCNKSITKCV